MSLSSLPGSGTAVQVAVRVRPLTAKEILSNCSDCIEIFENGPEDDSSGARNKVLRIADKAFTFDYIFDKGHSQGDVYDGIGVNLLNNFLQGFNATILAYGQTGSGKTFSMGTGLEHGALHDKEAGIVPRTVNSMFELLRADAQKKFQVTVSFLELYNEELFDLLNPSSLSAVSCRPSTSGPVTNYSASAQNVGNLSQPLQIREDGNGGLVWRGVSEKVCNSAEQVMFYLQQGSLCRATGSTDMNATSSRSHALFCVSLRQFQEEGSSVVSKFNFVDLAGSERLKRTKAEGDRAKEGIAINAGLLALGNVISSLADDAKHVPYRDSKLTRILQDSLGGNSLTAMLACISPSDSNIAESINTLRYADRAKSVKNRAVINTEFLTIPQSTRELEKENRTLRALVDSLRGQLAFGDANVTGADLGNGKAMQFCEQQQRQLDINKEQTRQIVQDLSTMRQKVEMAQAEMLRLDKMNRKLRVKVRRAEKEAKQYQAELSALGVCAESGMSEEDKSKALKQLGRQKIEELEAKIVYLEDQLMFQTSLASTKPLARSASGNLTFSPLPNIKEPPRDADGDREDALNSEIASLFYSNAALNAAAPDARRVSVTRDHIEDGSASEQDDDDMPNEDISSDFDGDEHQNDMLRELHQLQQDISLKEDLVQKLEKSQTEYAVMRQRYEEKLHLLQATLTLAEQERDSAMKRALLRGKSGGAESREQVSEKHQDKIRKLGKEIEQIKKRYEQASKSMLEKKTQNEHTLKSMRSNIEALKNEKTLLVKQLHQESQKLKKVVQRNDLELDKLKRKEKAAAQLANKLLAANKAQLALLERRNEQVLCTRKENRKLKSVMAVLKKQKSAKTIAKKSPKRQAKRPLATPSRSRQPTHEDAADETQSGYMTFKRNMIDVELQSCLGGLLLKQKLDALLFRRHRLEDERNELQLERQQILAMEPGVLETEPQYMDGRLSEIAGQLVELVPQIGLLKEALLNKGFATFLSSYYGSSFVFDGQHIVGNVLVYEQMQAPLSVQDLRYFGFQNACHLLKSLPPDQMEQLVEHYLGKLLELQVHTSKLEAQLATQQLKSKQLQKAILSNSVVNSVRLEPRIPPSEQRPIKSGSTLGLVTLKQPTTCKAEPPNALEHDTWKETFAGKRQKTDSESNKSELEYMLPSLVRSKSDGNVKDALKSCGNNTSFFTCPTSPSHSPTNASLGKPEDSRALPQNSLDAHVHKTRSGTIFKKTIPSNELVQKSQALAAGVVTPTPSSLVISGSTQEKICEEEGMVSTSLVTLNNDESAESGDDNVCALAHSASNVYDRLSSTHTVSSLQKVRESIAVIKSGVMSSLEMANLQGGEQ